MMRYLLIFFLLTTPAAIGQSVYVDAANEGGTEDGTSGNPWGTIAEGLSDAADGETVYIKGGTAYTGETLQTGDKTLTLVGYTTTITDNGQAEIDATSVTYGLEINTTTRKKWVTLRNLEIYSATSHGVFINNSVNTFVQTNNCILRDNGGAGFYGADNIDHHLTAINSVFADNTSSGAVVGVGIVAHSCLAANNGGDGFWCNLDAYFSDCVAVNNTGEGFEAGSEGNYAISAIGCVSDKNGGDGMCFTTRASPCIANCVLLRNGDYGVQFEYTNNGAIVNCAFGASSFANTTDQIDGGNIYSSTTFSADPFTAIWATTTNEAWEGQDYRVTSDSDLFDALAQVGELNNVMQAYTSIGPKVQNSASGSGAIIIAPRRHGN